MGIKNWQKANVKGGQTYGHHYPIKLTGIPVGATHYGKYYIWPKNFDKDSTTNFNWHPQPTQQSTQLVHHNAAPTNSPHGSVGTTRLS